MQTTPNKADFPEGIRQGDTVIFQEIVPFDADGGYLRNRWREAFYMVDSIESFSAHLFKRVEHEKVGPGWLDIVSTELPLE